jgi:hypothetical protein
MESGELAVEGACVLELGAGAGLPSLTASLCGARAVAATDYGTASDDALIQALRCNAATLAAQRAAAPACADWRCDVAVAPFVWGSDVAPLLALLPPGCAAFDRIVLADLLFNRQSHKQLLTTCQVRHLCAGCTCALRSLSAVTFRSAWRLAALFGWRTATTTRTRLRWTTRFGRWLLRRRSASPCATSATYASSETSSSRTTAWTTRAPSSTSTR